MFRTLILGLTLALFLATAPLAAQPDPAPPAAADGPVAAVAAFHRALAGGERDAALEALAPEVVIYESGGVEASRDEYASHHLGADMAFAAATEREVLEQTLHEAGDDVAWVLTRSRTQGTYREREIEVMGVETIVLRRATDDQEGWRIVHVHWSSRSAR